MSKYLVKVEETYRAETEKEASDIINEAKDDGRFNLAKYTSVQREKKQKGEVVDDWYRVTLTKVFTDEKEPSVEVFVDYNTADVSNNFEVK